MGMEDRATPLPLEQCMEAGRIATVGQMHGDAAGRGDARSRQLCGHAAAAPAATIPSHRLERCQFPWMADIGNGAGVCVDPGIG